jgi:hypothetical protein
MLKVVSLAAVLALAACATAAPPPAGLANGAGLIDRYDDQLLRSILAELGYTISEQTPPSSAKPMLIVDTPQDFSFRLLGESCEGEGGDQICQGVQLSTQFAENGADFDEIMARANRTLRPAKVFRVDAGLAYERYLIMDGGVSRENLKTEIEVFVEILGVLWKQIAG